MNNYATPIWTIPIIDHKPVQINEFAFKKTYRFEDVKMYIYTSACDVDKLVVELPNLDKQEFDAYAIFMKSECFRFNATEEKAQCIFEYLINNALFCFPTEEFQL